jgi:hypothetical protein
MRARKSATVSKNRGRGRPRKFDLDALRQDPRLAGRSTRTLQNAVYQARAEHVLSRPEHQEQVRWLFEPRRPTILAELGRIEDDPFLVEQAEWICAERPQTHVAVAMLRHNRTWSWSIRLRRRRGQHPEEVLADRLLAEINRYLRVQPSVQPTAIRKALTRVRQTLAVDQALEKGVGQ